MATISINNIASAIYESSKNKEGLILDDISKNAINLIKNKHLMSRSKEILSKLQKIVDKEENTIRAKVSSRINLDKKMIDDIENFIKRKYKTKNAVLDLKIDSKLLGGIKLEVEDEVIDMTLKNKIKKLQNFLIKN